MDRLLAQGVVQYPSAQAKAREAQPGQKPEQIEERTYAVLARNLGIDARTLREKLPAFAEQLKRSPDARTYERANAAFVAKDYAEAERLALNAAEEAKKADPPRITDALKALELAGWSALNRIEYARALIHFRAAAPLTNRQRDALEWARVQNEIAFVLDDQGHSSEAETILRDVVNVREQVIGTEHPDTLTSRNNLAIALRNQGKYAEAEAEYREVIKLGIKHPSTLESRNALAWLLATCPDAKIRNGSEAMALATNVCELSQWSSPHYLDTLAAAEAEAGLFDAAVKHQQQAIDLAKAGKVDVKDSESRLSLYQQHKSYRTAAKH